MYTYITTGDFRGVLFEKTIMLIRTLKVRRSTGL